MTHLEAIEERVRRLTLLDLNLSDRRWRSKAMRRYAEKIIRSNLESAYADIQLIIREARGAQPKASTATKGDS